MTAYHCTDLALTRRNGLREPMALRSASSMGALRGACRLRPDHGVKEGRRMVWGSRLERILPITYRRLGKVREWVNGSGPC
jgi:hypothetical protein